MFNIKSFLVFIATLVAFISSYGLVAGAATNNDVSSNITSLTANPDNLNDGDITTVHFEFDDHSQPIKPGDTLSVNWQGDKNVYGNGYEKEMDYKIDGISVGTLKIFESKATITFNDNISNVNNVKGYAEFPIKGRNVTPTNDANTGYFNLYGGSKNVKITVNKAATTPSKENFYYKVGEILTDDANRVRWSLNINNNKENVNNSIVIGDQTQSGQQLDPSTFNIYIDGKINQRFIGKNAVNNFKAAYPGVTFDISGNDFKLIIPESLASGNHINIDYRANIEDYNQTTFLNNSQISYQVENETPVVEKEYDASAKNININGGIDGSGITQVSVNKVWNDNNNEYGARPQNVTVQLYANGKPTLQPITLDGANAWKYVWNNLVKQINGEPVQYSVKEINVPENYEQLISQNESQKFIITKKFQWLAAK
ncbi:Cna B-type domain-containing protein [Fructilactobacillus cliffordii]|uniref:Cna B-type domain-containing protein n=1 Tax=Fructilactobacillus cliffordii TaxID=2940299 RepID=A0A9Q8ZTM5_9LACO|nr:Cna B-type domain-containing protein [Fructilactobacillus cliffordii]USS89118.1 Cna B-type domain-containing protein [Fructilactobacillus cliffordii]